MSIKEIFDSLSRKTVLVIGDVMIDSYLFAGQKNKEEAPFPILNVNKKEKRLGGAANVALNIQALGATPILCSVVGDDHDGQTFERLLDYQGMPNKGIIRSQNRRTTNKLRILSGSQQVIRVDSEDVHPLIDLDRKALLHHIRDLIKECDLIIFEDYDKGTVHSEIIAETISLAKEKNIPVAVDPKQHNFLEYRNTSLFKPSLKELASVFDGEIDLSKKSNLKKAVDVLDKKVRAEKYIISMEGGDIYFQTNEFEEVYPTYHTGVSDMSGVGNTIISLAGLGLTLDISDEFMAELINIAAGIVAGSTGVVPINKDHLLKEAIKSQILAKYL